jgi:hypothetical protein
MGDDKELFNYRTLSDEQLQFYAEQGYVLCGSLLTSKGVAAMLEDSMQAWRKEQRQFDPDKTWLQNMLLPNVHHLAEIVRRYYFHGPLVDIAEQIIGPNIKGATSQLSFKLTGNNKTAQWHQDNGYGELDPPNAITCITAFDLANEESGGLWVVPGAHRSGQINVSDQFSVEGKQRGAEIRIEMDETQAIPVTLNPGECLIFNGWMPHKSDGNRSEHDRRLLFLRYADADAVEVYNDRKPRLGRLVRGQSRFPEVTAFEADLD